MDDLPQDIQINGWTAEAGNRAPFRPDVLPMLVAGGLALPDTTLAPKPIDAKNWRDDRVGWGVVLPDTDDWSIADKARALDAPASLQALIAERGGVVLRYRPKRKAGTIRRHYADGRAQDIDLASPDYGTKDAQIPRYLLIHAPPSVIPWAFQFELQGGFYFVGRIDLTGDALDRYVAALRTGWGQAAAQPNHTLVWATDHDPGDISHLMRDSIAAPLHAKFVADGAIESRFVDGLTGDATAAALQANLGEHRPVLIATTSHGLTGPLDDQARMAADLGRLVDADRVAVDGAALLGDWQPGGAIWYAHACCSAGSNARSDFTQYVAAGSDVAKILAGVAGCGETLAPFPRALLSAEQPLAAFVGHVEPTFDWTLRHRRTGQFLTAPLLDALYQRLFTGEPIGMALDSCRRTASALLNVAVYEDRRALTEGKTAGGDVLATWLTANDWRAFVLIGDPTCTLVTAA